MRPWNAVALVLVAGAVLTGAARAEEWKRMRVVTLASGSAPSAVTALWDRDIAANEDASRANRALFRGTDGRLPVSFQFATFDDRAGAVSISVIFDHYACDPGVNSATSDAIETVCTGKAAREGQLPVALSGACFVDVSPEETPGLDPAKNGEWASYDPATRRIHVVAVSDGRPIPGCDRTAVLP